MAKPKPPPATALATQDDTALQVPGPVRDRLIAQLAQQGVKNVRINVIYGKVKAEGYGKIEDEVNALRRAGIQPQMTIMGTPRYAPTMDQGLSYQNTNPALMRTFAQEVASRFKGRVGRYSVWNEPNHDAFIAGASKDPKKAGRIYRNLYRAGYAGIKGADPQAQVLLGEITSAPGAKTFLQSVLGGKPLKTAGVAFHPYDQAPATVQGSKTWDIDTLGELQATLGRYKRQGRLQTAQGQAAPLYLTEFGYQRGEMNDPARMQAFASGYAKARAAGARQLLQYQLMPTQRPNITTPGPAVAGAYGSLTRMPGQTKPSTDWVWDTSIADASGNLPRLPRLARPVKAARAARRR